ncbi:TPA: hypothetical protein ACY4ZU_004026 [Yersinia enterocolitica]|nr:hypothetical protein [Yersinia enterocolitica]HDW3131437.1 hypothetical protein [Yersinia enterocolitica]HEN3551587.1 hypothetical protein [Yersinia enterocolitica]
MKITDQEILTSIFHETAKKLPYFATNNYFGNRRGLGSTDEWSQRYATQICTAYRENVLKLGLSSSQSMLRIRKLASEGHLVAEKVRPGQSFYFSLPESETKPMFERTIELLANGGITKEPVSDVGFDELAANITEMLVIEFGDKGRVAA